MKRRFSLFTYPMMDMKAAEAELNRRAAAGWQLEKVWMGVLAVFVPAHVPVCYCIDWSDPGRDDGPGYRALLADAGWRLRQRVTCQNIYEAPAGTTPIQTDSVLEYRRFQDRALRRMVIRIRSHLLPPAREGRPCRPPELRQDGAGAQRREPPWSRGP